MATLAQLIQPHLDSTDAEIVALLNTPSITVTNTERWTWAGLALRFNPAIVGTIDEVLKSIQGMDWVRMQLAGGGIDFSLESTQSTLESLRAVPELADHIDNLKAIGIRQVSPYQDAGFVGDVTLQDVEPVHADLITRRDSGAYWSRVLAVVNPMIDAGSTAAEIKAAAMGVEL